MKIADVIGLLDDLANPQLQESYDNSGFLVGDKEATCTGILVSLDVTEAVIEEAAKKGCNLIISHHPLIFKGLKRLTGANYVERIAILAIRSGVALYAIHTNLDNVASGVNGKIAELLGLKNTKVLSPRPSTLKKLVTFVPADYAEQVRMALFTAGGGGIGNYDQCSYNLEGTGTFRPLEGANPFVGEVGERHYEKEVRIEVILPFYAEKKIIQALQKAHPYEEVAYYISGLDNSFDSIGSGLVGELPDETDEKEFLYKVKNILKTSVLRHTELLNRKVRKIALCGGSGFFLLPAAKASGAQVYLTADVKYHEFFDADRQILLVDAGHYETEQYTIDLLTEHIQKNFPNFAVLKTECLTNPVRYYV